MAGIHNVLAGINVNPPVLVGSQYTQSTSVTSFSQPVPAGFANDLIVLFVISPAGVNLPSGWTQLANFATTGLFTLIFYKTASTPTESNFTVTGSGSQNVGSAIFRFSGASPTPTASSPTAFSYGTSGNAAFDAMDSDATDYCIQYFHAANASVTFAKPSGSIAALLTDSNATSPSFASFYTLGAAGAGSSSFTQPSGGVIRGGQIRMRGI